MPASIIIIRQLPPSLLSLFPIHPNVFHGRTPHYPDPGWSVSKEARTEKNLISIKQVQGSCLQQPGSDHTTLLSSLSFDYFREDLKEEDIQSARHLQLGRVQRREQSISQSIDDCYTRHKISTVSPSTGPHRANSHQTEFHQEVKRCNVDLSEPKYLILFL